MVANPARGQVNREKSKKNIFPCPRSRLRIWPRERSSHVSQLILHTQAESGVMPTHGAPPAFRDSVIVHIDYKV